MLRFLARLLAVLCAAAFVAATVVVVFVHPLGTRLLDPQTFKDLWREQRIGERFPALSADAISRALTGETNRLEQPAAKSGEGLGGFVGAFNRADTETLIGAVLPADYVNGQFDGAMDQLFSYLNGNAARPSLVLSFTEFKRRLDGGVLEDAYIKLLQSKPLCPAGALTEMPTSCQPAADQIPAVRAKFREMIAPIVKDTPDSVDLLKVNGANSRETEAAFRTLADFRERTRTFAKIAQWSWALPAALLLGVAVFGVRSFRGLLLWWGIPCFIAGLAALVFSLPGTAAASWFYKIAIEPQLPPQVPMMIIEACFNFVTAIAHVVLGFAFKAGAILAGGGLLAMIVSPMFRARPAAPPPVAPAMMPPPPTAP